MVRHLAYAEHILTSNYWEEKVVLEPSVAFHMENADFKFESGKMFLRKFWWKDPKFKWKFQAILETAFCERVSLCPPSNGEGVRDIQHSMRMIPDTKFHIWLNMTRYCKMRQILLQNGTAILLQNATEVYCKLRQVSYYKMRQFYYKMRQLLKIATISLQNATVITKCHVYCKLRQYICY